MSKMTEIYVIVFRGYVELAADVQTWCDSQRRQNDPDGEQSAGDGIGQPARLCVEIMEEAALNTQGDHAGQDRRLERQHEGCLAVNLGCPVRQLTVDLPSCLRSFICHETTQPQSE